MGLYHFPSFKAILGLVNSASHSQISENPSQD
jgi:hypothetical protein